MTAEPNAPFRERAPAFFTKALGKPQEVPVESGLLYRWAIARHGSTSLSVYITLDSPEMPDYGHIMISDPSCGPDNEPIKSFIMRTEADFERVLAMIQKQINRI